jgi:hypothetical protein
MSLKLRYFTVPEANSLIGPLTDIFSAAREIRNQIEGKIDFWRSHNGNLTEADEMIWKAQVDYLAVLLERELSKIVEMGALPKDLDMGLVDFPARIDGQEGHLCWRFGENQVEYWHNLTEGFSGRRPIPVEARNL